jgi:hypothetical protein
MIAFRAMPVRLSVHSMKPNIPMRRAERSDLLAGETKSQLSDYAVGPCLSPSAIAEPLVTGQFGHDCCSNSHGAKRTYAGRLQSGKIDAIRTRVACTTGL